MFSQLPLALNEPKYLSEFLFGIIIIVLYAKDKFNLPTYDREAMGPFAQLPPQSLTIDTRYRHGRAVYLGMILSLYLVICILGPTIPTPGIFSSASQMGQSLQLGPQMQPGAQGDDLQIWPMAAATFLISTAAAGDNTMLGRIELFIRQYAHRSAYIPSAVSNLAFSLRHLAISQWLIANPYLTTEQIKLRQRALANMIGDTRVTEIMQQPDDELDLAIWVRANILFYTVTQIFNKQHELSNTRLDYLTDLPENRKIFDNLRSTQEDLRRRFDAVTLDATSDADKLFSDIRRFSKDTAITIAVLLSQAARNSAELVDRLDQFGFQGVQLPDRADHFGYLVLVYAFIASGLIVLAFALYGLQPHFKPGGAVLDGVSAIFDSTDYRTGLATLCIGCLVYLVVFRVTDYSRDRALDSMEWTEGLGGYVRVVLVSSTLSSIVAIIAIILFLALVFGSVSYVLQDLSRLFSLFIFQLVLAILGTSFCLAYLRQAARLPRGRTNFVDSLFSALPVLHASAAAVFVAGMTYIIAQHDKNMVTQETQKISHFLRDDLQQSESNLIKALPDIAATQIITPLKNIYAMVNQLPFSDVKEKMGGGGDRADTQTNESIVTLLERPRSVLQQVCATLNKVPLKSAKIVTGQPAQATGQAQQEGGDGPDAAGQPPLTLFSAEQSCTLAPITVSDQSERILASLANDVNGIYQEVDILRYLLDDPVSFKTIVFPMLCAFVIAFSFGLGCLHWRAWWLNEGADDSLGRALQNKIKEVYGENVDVETWLITPIASLDQITSIEALRYEDYRAKLFRQLQKGQIKEFAGLKCAADSRPKGQDASGSAGSSAIASV
jgi:hypothetical protein